ncbi:MAG: exodeoxyribonuclease III [Porticoccaceae bacterium]|nr:MAG: exodeoxyribonuclease III [Porticoccaceae bacterium]
MKIVSFNANGLRARLHQLKAIVETYAPDIIGLQEIKVSDDQFPLKDINELGYDVIYHGQKGHYGVALLYRLPLMSSLKGFPQDGEESQKRLVFGQFELNDKKIHIFNGYFPQGESRDHPLKFPCKQQFYADLLNRIKEHHQPDELVLVMGDMNVAPLDKDIGIGDDNRKRWLRAGKCCFLPEEREWLKNLEQWGLQDSYQYFHPDEVDRYSWFDYRSRGFEREPKRGLRIDLMLASKPLMDLAIDAGIDQTIRAMEKPSDHCPIWLSLKS